MVALYNPGGRLPLSMAKTAVNKMFRAFSDPTRLRILHLLMVEKEMCVGDLVTVLRVPQPTASRHLSYLRRSGLVGTRKASLWTYYGLLPACNSFHRELLKCLKSCFQDVPELSQDARRAKGLRKNGGCCPI
jgi:ArsR family transcriptional regulator